MTPTFIGYQHYNRYRNEFAIVGATSRIDFDQKKLDELQAACEDIYEDDGIEINMGLPDDCRYDTAFDILKQRLLAQAIDRINSKGRIESAYLGGWGRSSIGVYDDAEDYIADIVQKVEQRVERDDFGWEWDRFVESLQYMLDELMAAASARNPDMPAPKYVRVRASNIDWRGRSGYLVCEADANVLLDKVTGTHNSPEYDFLWGDQKAVTDDFGDVMLFTEQRVIRMIMPHHDAVTTANIEAVWCGDAFDTEAHSYMDEDELVDGRARHAALLALAERIAGNVVEQRRPTYEWPRIWRIVGFDSRSLVDPGDVAISAGYAEYIIGYMIQDIWFWAHREYAEEADTMRLIEEVRGHSTEFWAEHISEFRDAMTTIIEMIESDDINCEQGE